jgi:hypothetical protein
MKGGNKMENNTLESTLEGCQTKEQVFDAFKNTILSEIKEGKDVLKQSGSFHGKMQKFGKYFLSLELGKNTTLVHFSCGCRDKNLMQDCMDSTPCADSVEARIMAMFGYRSRGVCDIGDGYEDKYADFMSEDCINKYPELYIALAISGQGKNLETYTAETPNGTETDYKVRKKFNDIVSLAIYRSIITDSVSLPEEYKSKFKSEMKTLLGQYYEPAQESLRSGIKEYYTYLNSTLLDVKKVCENTNSVFEKVFSYFYDSIKE